MVEKALEKAENLRQARQLDEARETLIDALEHGVEIAQIYYRLGNIYFDLKDYDKAEYTYRRAIDTDPKHINAHHNLSVVFRKQNRIAESIKQRKKASKIARQNPDKIEFSEDQVKTLKGFARKIIWFGLGLVGLIIVLVLILIS